MKELHAAFQIQMEINDTLAKRLVRQQELSDNLHERLVLLRKTLDDVLLSDAAGLAKLKVDAAVRRIREGLEAGLHGFIGEQKPMQGLAAQIDEDVEIEFDPEQLCGGTAELLDDDCCGNGCPTHEDEEIL